MKLIKRYQHGGKTYNAGLLPEVIVNGYAPIRLTTYYPFISAYPYTGHSKLDIPIDRKTWDDYIGEEPDDDKVSPYMTINKKMRAKNYNFITNNCADATLKYLNKAFNTSESPILFTTPGDVRDYAINKLHGKVVKNNNGSDTVLIPRNKDNAKKLSTTALDMFDEDMNGIASLSYQGMFKKHKNGGIINKYLIGGYVQPSNVLESINNGSAAEGLLEGFGKVVNKILPTWFLKAGTYLSPLNYAAALSKGSINPKVGEEVISKWHPNLLLAARTGEIVLGGKAVKGAGKAAVNTAAKAGNKTARAYLISKELNTTVKKGLKPAPSKTDYQPFDMDDLIANYNSGKQNLESWWLDRELNTGDPNKLVHYDNGDFKPHFWKNDIHGNKVKGAYVKDSKLIPPEGEFLRRLWWSAGKPFLDSHFRHKQSSRWGQPKRYITVNRSAGDFELMYYSDPFTMNPIPADEIVSNGSVDLSNASIIQKSPFGWWERVKFYTKTKPQDSKTSLKFFERKPSRISEAEKAGISKGERNNKIHGQSLAPYYDYSLINKHYEPWAVNEKGLFVFESPEKAGKLGTLHFTFNEPVMSHMMGSWDDAPTVTLLPYRNVRSLAAPVDMAIMDTFFPNYKGLKISSRGAKTLTGDKKTFDYYKSKGLDVEFSPEMEGLLQQLQEINTKLELLKNSGNDYFSPEMLELYKQLRTFKDKINSIGVEWSKKHVKPIPSYEKVNALGKAEGFDVEKYPYSLASPKKDAYGVPLEASDTELNYTWQSDPSNHFMMREHPEVVLKSALNGEYGKVRPEFIKYLEWASKHKADYRKKGGKLCLIPRIK